MKLFGFIIVSERKLAHVYKAEYLRGKSAAFVEAIEEIRLKHGADSTLSALSLLKEWADFDLAKHAGIERAPPAENLYRRTSWRRSRPNPAPERTGSPSQAQTTTEQTSPSQQQGEKP